MACLFSFVYISDTLTKVYLFLLSFEFMYKYEIPATYRSSEIFFEGENNTKRRVQIDFRILHVNFNQN